MVNTFIECMLAEKLESYKPELFHLRNYFYNVEVIRDDGKLEFNPVIAEDRNCLTALLAFTFKKTPVVVEGLSGSGKTRIIEAVMSLIPPLKRLELRMGSEKSAWYQADTINKADFIIVPELQKAHGHIQEILKDWGEGRRATYDRTKITMPDDGDQVVHHYLYPKPFLTSRALENKEAEVGAELGRRVIRLRTNSQIEQTKKIIQYKLKLKERPTDTLRTMENDDISMLKYHIEECVELPEYDIKLPGASALHRYVPSLFRISSSHIEYFFNVIDAATIFYNKDRIKYLYQNGGEKKIILLSVPADIYYAWTIYGREFVELCLEMPELGRPILSVFPKVTEKVDGTLEANASETLTEKQIIQAVREKQGIMLKRGDVRKQILKLVFTGYLEEYEGEENGTNLKRYNRTNLANMLLTDNPLDWSYIIEICKKTVSEVYPEIADDYIKRFCGDKIEVMHPITGSMVDIYDDKNVIKEGEFEDLKASEIEITKEDIKDNQQIIEGLYAETK